MDQHEEAPEFEDTDSKNFWHQILSAIMGHEVGRFSYRLEPEVDVTIAQVLDASITSIEKEAPDKPANQPLPDGLTDLLDFNLVTMKFDETLNIAVLQELISYLVLYRKTFSRDSRKNWSKLPQEKIGLYAISTRQPSTPEMKSLLKPSGLPGVFEVDFAGESITVIVPRKTDQHPRNALWHLVSLNPELMQHGARNFDWNFAAGAVIYNSVSDYLQTKGINMATLEDYKEELGRRGTAWFLKTHPDYLVENPEILKENPEILKENPEILKENPEILKENPEIVLDFLQQLSKEERAKLLQSLEE